MSYEGREFYQDKAVASAYEQSYTERLSIRTIKQRIIDWGEKRALTTVASHLQDCELTDLACGTGRISEFWLQRGLSVRSSDISAEMMAFAAPRLQKYENFRGFSQGDAEKTPYDSDSTDCVSAVRLLQRVPPERYVAMLTEFARVSRQWVIVSFATTSPYIRVLNVVKGILFEPHPLQMHSVDIPQFLGFARAAGLEPVRISRVLPAISQEVFVCFRKSQTEQGS